MRLYKLILILMLFSSPAWCCDVCGCKLGGLSMGVTPQSDANYFGIRYNMAQFDASIVYNSEFFEDEFSSDTFQRFDLLGKFNLVKNLQLNIMLPYLINNMDGNLQKVDFKGFGDPLVQLFYNVINTSMDPGRSVNHSFLVGAGIKLPFGSSDQSDNEELINRNFQLGTGSVDYQLSAMYTMRLGLYGIATEAGYRINTANSDGYEFSDQSNISLNMFYLRESPQIGLLPYAGLYYEYADSHSDNGILQVNTGGSALLANLGMQIYLQKITLSLATQVPISQSYNTDQFATIEEGSRLSLDMLYQF